MPLVWERRWLRKEPERRHSPGSGAGHPREARRHNCLEPRRHSGRTPHGESSCPSKQRTLGEARPMSPALVTDRCSAREAGRQHRSRTPGVGELSRRRSQSRLSAASSRPHGCVGYFDSFRWNAGCSPGEQRSGEGQGEAQQRFVRGDDVAVLPIPSGDWEGDRIGRHEQRDNGPNAEYDDHHAPTRCRILEWPARQCSCPRQMNTAAGASNGKNSGENDHTTRGTSETPHATSK